MAAACATEGDVVACVQSLEYFSECPNRSSPSGFEICLLDSRGQPTFTQTYPHEFTYAGFAGGPENPIAASLDDCVSTREDCERA
jgi:hypothetical protein